MSYGNGACTLKSLRCCPRRSGYGCESDELHWSVGVFVAVASSPQTDHAEDTRCAQGPSDSTLPHFSYLYLLTKTTWWRVLSCAIYHCRCSSRFKFVGCLLLTPLIPNYFLCFKTLASAEGWILRSYSQLLPEGQRPFPQDNCLVFLVYYSYICCFYYATPGLGTIWATTAAHTVAIIWQGSAAVLH